MATRMGCGPFHGDADDWKCYVGILKNHFVANNVTDDAHKRAVFLAEVGLPTYKLLRSLCLPDAPETKSFDALVELLTNHIAPTPSRFLARWSFNQRCQAEGEKVSEYAAALHDLSKDCNYGQMRSELIRDRLVCGISSSLIRSRLLELSDDATLQVTLDLAVSLERAADNSKKLEHHSTNAVKSSHSVHDQDQRCSVKCNSCGGLHDRRTCKFVNAICFKCQRKGHIAKVCRSKGSLSAIKSHKLQASTSRQHFVEEPSKKRTTNKPTNYFTLLTANQRHTRSHLKSMVLTQPGRLIRGLRFPLCRSPCSRSTFLTSSLLHQT